MWLINKIKKLFKKTIECPVKNRNELVFMFVPKNRTIKLNTTLEVPKNYVAFVRAKDVLLDYFTEGTFKMSIFTLPKVVKKLKLNKVNKKGDIKDRFKGDIYFVNLNKFNNIEFKNTEKISLFHKIYKGLIGNFTGQFDLSISNPQIFLKALFTEWAVVKGNMALEQAKIYVSDNLTRYLNLKKVDYFDFEENKENLIEDISSKIISKLNKIGLRIENLQITKTNISQKSLRKLQKEGANLNKDIELKTATDANIDIINHLEYGYQQQKYPSQNPQIESSFAPHIDDFEESNESKIETEYNYQQKTTSPKVEIQNNYLQEEFQQSSTLDFAQCPNCGTYISINAKICFSCGYDFENKKRCQNCGAKLHTGEIVCENCGQVNLKPE